MGKRKNGRLMGRKRRKVDDSEIAAASAGEESENDDNDPNDKPKGIRSYTSRGEGKGTEIHPGSYANPALRKMFGVDLPEMDEYLRNQMENQKKNNSNNDNGEGDDKPADSAATSAPVEQHKENEEETKRKDNEDDKNDEENTKNEPKRIKRKVAFLVGYLGSKYGGFQMNAGQRTLQAEFELAMFRCHLLRLCNFGYPYKYSWSTSGRTDKGVHACAQVCSAKIEILPNQTLTNVLDELNAVLPKDIRVLEINRVTKGFCAKTQRDRVRYQYMIPSFLCQPVSVVTKLMKEKIGLGVGDRAPTDNLSMEEIALLQPHMVSYRISPEQLTLLKQALGTFEGTHSFHNFSKGVKNNEARATRYIESFHVEDPIVFDNDGGGSMEWIPTQVLGQSFLLHQIRKMIWMAVEVTRGAAPLSLMETAFSRQYDMAIHPAPAQGLYLDMSFYRGYNTRKPSNNTDLPDLVWTNPDTDVYRRWHDFRNNMVMKHVVQEEHKDGNFVNFLVTQEFGDNRRHYNIAEETKEATSKEEGKEEPKKDDVTLEKAEESACS